MPASVTASMSRRKAQPVSPPIVPASRVRISDSHEPSSTPIGSPPSGAMPVIASTMPATTMTASETTASQPMSAIGPAAMDLSKA